MWKRYLFRYYFSYQESKTTEFIRSRKLKLDYLDITDALSKTKCLNCNEVFNVSTSLVIFSFLTLP